MSENRCGSCRWWKAEDSNAYEVGHMLLRDPLTHEPVDPQPFEVRECTSPKVRFYERPEVDGATVLDASEYMGLFVTGPEFGCVHWAPADE